MVPWIANFRFVSGALCWTDVRIWRVVNDTLGLASRLLHGQHTEQFPSYHEAMQQQRAVPGESPVLYVGDSGNNVLKVEQLDVVFGPPERPVVPRYAFSV